MSKYLLRIRLIVRDERGASASVLPVYVVDTHGQEVSNGAVSTSRTTELLYERGEGSLFARMTLPNGTTKTIPLQRPDGKWRDSVTFRIGEEVRTSDWMTWSAMRFDIKRQGGALLSQPGMKDAWFQLWDKMPQSERWRQIPLSTALMGCHHSSDAIQLNLSYSHHARALVVRLDSDITQVISIPKQQTSVLLTSFRTLSGIITPRVLVGGYSSNAETIMEFLRAGKLGPVESMLDPGSELAYNLLHDKLMDPIAATAAAYYLLRKRDWDRLPPQWLDNLSRRYRWIPDAQLIQATSQIERGMPMDLAANLAVETLSGFLEDGIPLFAEANSLLSDLLALADRARRPLNQQTSKMLRMMLASSRPAGLNFGFAGKAPDKPMGARELSLRRLEARSGQLLVDAARNISVITESKNWRLPSSINQYTSRRQLVLAAEALRNGADEIMATTRRTVPGSIAKTLFLQKLIQGVD